ncbi:unnamed protein product [Paramecium sonneborni]|uniref:Uncharacterized protein n=1 Tax=Paramecium sonneborni TaxID=65129 RepID=A0A8S1RN22_9CILI|nr:unnamed protein product [Paramecium sonneborni]
MNQNKSVLIVWMKPFLCIFYFIYPQIYSNDFEFSGCKYIRNIEQYLKSKQSAISKLQLLDVIILKSNNIWFKEIRFIDVNNKRNFKSTEDLNTQISRLKCRCYRFHDVIVSLKRIQRRLNMEWFIQNRKTRKDIISIVINEI